MARTGLSAPLADAGVCDLRELIAAGEPEGVELEHAPRPGVVLDVGRQTLDLRVTPLESAVDADPGADRFGCPPDSKLTRSVEQ